MEVCTLSLEFQNIALSFGTIGDGGSLDLFLAISIHFVHIAHEKRQVSRKLLLQWFVGH